MYFFYFQNTSSGTDWNPKRAHGPYVWHLRPKLLAFFLIIILKGNLPVLCISQHLIKCPWINSKIPLKYVPQRKESACMRKQVHLDTGMGTLRVISSVRHTHTEMWRWWLWVPVSRSGQVYSIFQQDHWRIMGSKSDMITTWSPHTFKFNRMQNKTSLFCLRQQKQIFFFNQFHYLK